MNRRWKFRIIIFIRFQLRKRKIRKIEIGYGSIFCKDGAYIRIQRSIVQVNDQLIEKETKTKSGKRTIPLAVGGTVYQILERARKEHMKLQSKPGFKGGNSVFLMNHAPHCFHHQGLVLKTAEPSLLHWF